MFVSRMYCQLIVRVYTVIHRCFKTFIALYKFGGLRYNCDKTFRPNVHMEKAKQRRWPEKCLSQTIWLLNLDFGVKESIRRMIAELIVTSSMILHKEKSN